jgi:hypothetical protein
MYFYAVLHLFIIVRPRTSLYDFETKKIATVDSFTTAHYVHWLKPIRDLLKRNEQFSFDTDLAILNYDQIIINAVVFDLHVRRYTMMLIKREQWWVW